MSEYSIGLIHGIALSVIADVISNFITIMIAKHIFNKESKVGNIIHKIFKRR